MEFAGFWRRASAFALDLAVMSPLYVGASYFLGKHTNAFYAYLVLPSFVFCAWYNIYLVKRFGGTPGKKLLGLTVTMQDGMPITFASSAMRYGVELVLYTISSVGFAIAASKIPESTYITLSMSERGAQLRHLEPLWSRAAGSSLIFWAFIGMLLIIFNKRKRSAHDLLAGTVVLRAKKIAN